jgi:hypothetical protein
MDRFPNASPLDTGNAVIRRVQVAVAELDIAEAAEIERTKGSDAFEESDRNNSPTTISGVGLPLWSSLESKE